MKADYLFNAFYWCYCVTSSYPVDFSSAKHSRSFICMLNSHLKFSPHSLVDFDQKYPHFIHIPKPGASAPHEDRTGP